MSHGTKEEDYAADVRAMQTFIRATLDSGARRESWMKAMEVALGFEYVAPELWPERAAALRAKAEATALNTFDNRKLTSRAVSELRHKVEYLSDAVLDLFHLLNAKASRRPDRDVMKAAATVRGQTAYLSELLRTQAEVRLTDDERGLLAFVILRLKDNGLYDLANGVGAILDRTRGK